MERGPERQFEEREFVDTLYRRALGILQEDMPHPDDFQDIRPEEEIREDNAYVADREEKFKQADREKNRREGRPEDAVSEDRKLSTILEAIIHEHGELSNWLGGNAYTTKASRFDDIAHGVDTVVEFDEDDGAQHLAFAMDVTISSTGPLKNKLERIKNEDIGKDKLPSVKYFRSENTDERLSLEDVPRVVVGIDRKTMQEVMELWERDDKDGLRDHRVKHIILRELEMQLRAYGDYAEKKGKDGIAARYRQDLEIIERIIKEEKSEESEQYTGDKVFDEIRTYTMFKLRG